MRDHDMPALDSAGAMTRPLLLLGLAGGLLLAATAGLWVYHGNAVFFEIIRAGWMACF